MMNSEHLKLAKTAKKHLFLIDGYSFVFRAYHSLPPMSSPDGTPVNALYGFTNMLLKLKERLREGEDHYMLVAFDAGSKTFRNKIYSDYKAHRPPAPEDLVPQFPLMEKAVAALNLRSLAIKGYEADDIIATYTQRAQAEQMQVTIVSSDKDLMQLIDDDVEMFDSMKDKRIGINEVEEKFGVKPNKVLDVLALMGDSADNIPGVPGIGPKIAAELVNQFGSMEEILERAETIQQKKRKENLINFADQARLSKQLASLEYNTPVEDDINSFHVKPSDTPQLLAFLHEYGFKSLANRVNKQSSNPVTLADINTHTPTTLTTPTTEKDVKTDIINSSEQLKNWLPSLQECRALSLWAFSFKNTPTSLCIAKSPYETCLIPWESTSNKNTQEQLFAQAEAPATENSFSITSAIELLNPYLTSTSIAKIGFDLKSLMHLLSSSITPLHDVQVMAYCLNGTKNTNDVIELIEHELLETIPPPEALQNKKCDIATIEANEYSTYTGKIVSSLLTLNTHLTARLFKEKMVTLYETIDRPLVSTLHHVEKNGIKVDPQILKNLSRDFTRRINELEENIQQKSNKEFNVASPKQLGEVLFEHMGIEGGKKTKTGAYKTDVDILQELAAQGHTIADDILEWRSLSKLKNTYTDALTHDIRPDNGRIHSTFAMTSTSTGRLSSLSPNLQNIPIRTEEGRKIRDAFIPQKNYTFIGADYSQIELRLLAHMASIEPLREAFIAKKDIHATTASQVFGTPLENITPEQRRNAKAINFGIIYGQSAFGLANQLGISRSDAKAYIEQYFTQYPGIRTFMENTKEYAREHGYVTTLLGRKCFIPGINTKGPQRAFAERAAINAPLQGTAADIIRKAMVQVEKKLIDYDAKMLLQVHDELIIEVVHQQAEEVQQHITEIMQNVIRLSIPLVVDSTTGQSWNDIH